MSHFSVLVIGPDIENQLAPYHEFECTGIEDQYVRDVDKTAQYREEFAKATTTRLRTPDGALLDFFDAKGNWLTEFSQADPDFKPMFKGDLCRRTYLVPDGHEKVKVHSSEVMTFAEWIERDHGQKIVPLGRLPDLSGEHKYGYTIVDAEGEVVRAIDRTNPDKKWDWYSVGGRWMGFLKLKDGAAGPLGEPGVFGNESEHKNGADITMTRDVDFDGMRDTAEATARGAWDRAQTIIAGRSFETWKEVISRFHDDHKAARETYWEQPVCVDMRNAREFSWDGPDEFRCSLADYVARARRKAVQTFAVVKDGVWYARGTMGWWGVVHDEENEDEWERRFADLIDSLEDDALLTVVDCHI